MHPAEKESDVHYLPTYGAVCAIFARMMPCHLAEAKKMRHEGAEMCVCLGARCA